MVTASDGLKEWFCNYSTIVDRRTDTDMCTDRQRDSIVVIQHDRLQRQLYNYSIRWLSYTVYCLLLFTRVKFDDHFANILHVLGIQSLRVWCQQKQGVLRWSHINAMNMSVISHNHKYRHRSLVNIKHPESVPLMGITKINVVNKGWFTAYCKIINFRGTFNFVYFVGKQNPRN